MTQLACLGLYPVKGEPKLMDHRKYHGEDSLTQFENISSIQNQVIHTKSLAGNYGSFVIS